MIIQLVIEPKRNEDGSYCAAVVEIADDSVLFVTETYARVEDAARSAQAWIKENQ